MSTVKKSFLIELIDELTQSEKRYVRMHLQQRSGGRKNRANNLFDRLSNSKNLDEKEMKSSFPNYLIHKNYLTTSVFRALRNYHEPSTAEYVAHCELKHVMLCYEKSLFKEYDRRIKKLKAFCQEQNLFGTQLEVLKQEMWSNRHRNRENEALYTEMQSVIDDQQNWLEYIQLYDALLYKVLHADSRVQEDVQRIAQSKLLINYSSARTFLAQTVFHNSNMLVHYINQNYKKAHDHQKISFTLVMNNAAYLKYHGQLALITLGNLMTLSYFLNDIKLFESDYKKLIQSHKQIKGLDSLKFEQYIHFSLIRQKVISDYSTLSDLSEYYLNRFDQYAKTISFIKESDICSNFAVGFFKLKQYNKSFDWLNRVLNHPKVKTRPYMFEAAILLELVLLYDAQEHDLLDYKSRSAYRYFRRKETPTPFELWFIQFLRSFPNRLDKKALMNYLKNQRKKLKALPEEELQYFSTIHFDYNEWLNEKIKMLK